MADDFDQASDLEIMMRQHSIDAQRAAAQSTPRLQATGICFNPLCREELETPGQLFCGPKCAQEHARRTR